MRGRVSAGCVAHVWRFIVRNLEEPQRPQRPQRLERRFVRYRRRRPFPPRPPRSLFMPPIHHSPRAASAARNHGRTWVLLRTLCWLGLLMLPGLLPAQAAEGPTEEASGESAVRPVQVERVIEDAAIARRLERILGASGWYELATVRSDQGIVFLDGWTTRESHRTWATTVASNTEGVVAVVNAIKLREASMWDLSAAWRTMTQLALDTVRRIPLILLGLLVLVLSALLAVAVSRSADSLFRQRMRNALLRSVFAKMLGVGAFLAGLYTVLRIAGLERLAVTVLGGTGIAGLVVGFAFRDIAENFLASILMSLQRPFARGDLIEVAGFKGFVRQLNVRSTLLMNLQGHYVQIPNATVYSNPIVNYSANPRVLSDFIVGIGYEDSILRAQELGMTLMRQHDAVLGDPEPLVLVETLGPSTVDLHFLFWVDSSKFSAAKVKSAIIRRVKRSYQEAGICLPDPNREVLFPQALPVHLLRGEKDPVSPPAGPDPRTEAEMEAELEAELEAAAPSEGRLQSDADAIKRQADQSRSPEPGMDLLDD